VDNTVSIRGGWGDITQRVGDIIIQRVGDIITQRVGDIITQRVGDIITQRVGFGVSSLSGGGRSCCTCDGSLSLRLKILTATSSCSPPSGGMWCARKTVPKPPCPRTERTSRSE